MIKDKINYNENIKPNTEFLNQLKEKLPEFFVEEKIDEDGNILV